MIQKKKKEKKEKRKQNKTKKEQITKYHKLWHTKKMIFDTQKMKCKNRDCKKRLKNQAYMRKPVKKSAKKKSFPNLGVYFYENLNAFISQSDERKNFKTSYFFESLYKHCWINLSQ